MASRRRWKRSAVERARKAEAVLVRAESLALVVLLTATIALSFWQVAQRQLFGTGLLWADTLLRHLVVVIGFLGAAVAAAEGKHFGFELFSHIGGAKGAAFRVVSNAAGAAVSALLARASWRYFLDERASGAHLFSVGEFNVPASAFAVTIPAGFILLVVHLTLATARAGADLRAPSPQ